MHKFLILYDDWTVWTDDDGAWEDAPGRGVQVVFFYDEKRGWTPRHGGDYFRMDPNGAVVAMDREGMVDYVVRVLGLVKVGYMLNQDEWDAIYARALDILKELRKG